MERVSGSKKMCKTIKNCLSFPLNSMSVSCHLLLLALAAEDEGAKMPSMGGRVFLAESSYPADSERKMDLRSSSHVVSHLKPPKLLGHPGHSPYFLATRCASTFMCRVLEKILVPVFQPGWTRFTTL